MSENRASIMWGQQVQEHDPTYRAKKVVGPTGTLATEAKQDDIITAVNAISGAGTYTTRIVSSGSYTYIGKAAIGSSTASAVWQVKRLDDTSGLTVLWADANDDFDNVWNNYASLSYS